MQKEKIMEPSGKAVDNILKSGPAAWFRAAKFRKKGRCFYRGYGELIHTAYFQTTWLNTPEDGTFAINLGVEWPKLHEIWTGTPEIKNPAIATCFIRARLHPEVGWGQDYWWRAVPVSEAATVSNMIVTTLDKYAESFWSTYSNLEYILHQLEGKELVACGIPKHVVLASLLVHFGRKSEAEKIMIDAIRKTVRNIELNKRISKRLGLEVA